MLSVTSTTLSESPKQGISFVRGYSWLARSLTRSRNNMKWGDDAYVLRPLQRPTFCAVEGYAWARGRPGQSDIGVGEVEALYKPDVRLEINFRAPCLETQLHQSDGKRAYPARGIGDLCATREMEKLNPAQNRFLDDETNRQRIHEMELFWVWAEGIAGRTSDSASLLE